MSLVVVKDVFDELKEENNRLINELLFADKCLKTLIQFKTFIDKISYLFEYKLEENDKKEYEELIRSVDGIRVDTEQSQTRRQTPNEEPFVAHMKSFACDLCDHRFEYRFGLKNHRENVHNGMFTNYIDESDGSKRSDSSCMKISIKTEPIEEMEVMTDSALTDDNATIDTIREKYRIVALNSNQKYRKEVKESQVVYVCHQPNCDRVFRTSGHLSIHQKSHIPRQMRVCPICQKKCKSDSALETHINTHDTIGRFQCTVSGCKTRFKNQYVLKSHMERVHGDKGMTCDLPGCQYKTDYVFKLAEHKLYHSDERNFPCEWPKCAKKFKTYNALSAHSKIHKEDKRFQCTWPGCDYKSTRSCNLKLHVISHHSEIKFECDWPECGKSYRSSTALESHLKNGHRILADS